FHGNYRRHIDIDKKFHFRTRSHPRAYNATYYGELGTTFFDCWCVGIQPFLVGEWGWYHLERFIEGGGHVVNFRGSSRYYGTADSFLGLRLATSLWCIDVIGEAAWQHAYTREGNRIKLEFEHFGDEFRIRGPKQGRDGFVGYLTLSVETNENMNIFFEVN